MARLHYVKAAKDYPSHKIKKGEMYYWWAFRFGGKRISKTQPRRSQLTQSEFFGNMYDAEDELSDAISAFRNDHDFEEFASACESIAENVRGYGEECDEKRSNMPDSLQDSETGQLLETRNDECNTIADDLESAAGEIRDCAVEESDHEDTPDQARLRRLVEELRDSETEQTIWYKIAQKNWAQENGFGAADLAKMAKAANISLDDDEMEEAVENAVSHAEGVSWDYS
jgi:predicted enzyme involved in methoxymalonyl-ACP biosynthesis